MISRTRKRVLVISGGPSEEHEVSLESGKRVAEGLSKKQYSVERAVIHKNGKWSFQGKKDIGQALHAISRRRFYVAFVALHGRFGEDGHIQALLESIGVPYTGSGVLASAIAMDKHITNTLLAGHGFEIPRYVIVHAYRIPRFRLPAVVKPVDGGSSVGITIARTAKNLRRSLKRILGRFGRAMIQEYIRGREVTCGVIEDAHGDPFPLIPTEIVPNRTFFDYRAKYMPGGSQEITPAPLRPGETKRLQELAVRAHRVLGCRGMSRSDFIFAYGKFYFLETNTIPGLTSTSLLPQGAQALGIDFPQLLELIVRAALRRKAARA